MNRGFTGREDEGDGLYCYRNRFYSATQQQFLSRDPIGLASGDANPYAYVLNQPTTLTDPMGTKPQSVASDATNTLFEPSGGVTSGGAQKLNVPGRTDGQTVFHGHGATPRAGRTTVVPAGTTIHFYGPHGYTITDLMGLRISGPTVLSPIESFGPGSEIPDYVLHPLGVGFKYRQSSVVVDQETPLSQLLEPDMGECHWAACRGNLRPRAR